MSENAKTATRSLLNCCDAGEYCIAANVSGKDRIFRDGAKCFLVGGTGGEGWYKFQWYGMSLNGVRVEKWCPTERMLNFRAAWIPPFVRNHYERLYIVGNKKRMQSLAEQLNQFREALVKPESP